VIGFLVNTCKSRQINVKLLPIAIPVSKNIHRFIRKFPDVCVAKVFGTRALTLFSRQVVKIVQARFALITTHPQDAMPPQGRGRGKAGAPRGRLAEHATMLSIRFIRVKVTQEPND
jgi:hypothetical protein